MRRRDARSCGQFCTRRSLSTSWPHLSSSLGDLGTQNKRPRLKKSMAQSLPESLCQSLKSKAVSTTRYSFGQNLIQTLWKGFIFYVIAEMQMAMNLTQRTGVYIPRSQSDMCGRTHSSSLRKKDTNAFYTSCENFRGKCCVCQLSISNSCGTRIRYAPQGDLPVLQCKCTPYHFHKITP